MRLFAAAATLLVCFCLTVEAGASVILNGDFSTPGTPPDPFDQWTTTSGATPPEDGGGFASFSENPFSFFLLQQLQQTFALPSNSQSLSFEYKLESFFGGLSGIPVPDSFQATLRNSSGTELFPSDPANGFVAFYSVDNLGNESFDSAFVSRSPVASGFTRVTLDTSSLAAQGLTVEFQLNGLADGRITTASLDNVEVSQSTAVIPEPSTIGIWFVLALTSFGAQRLRRLSKGKIDA